MPGIGRNQVDSADRPVRFAPHGLLLTDLAGFVAKSARFPGAVFLVGIDTWIRVADPRYYCPGMHVSSMELIALHHCRFLVFGRVVDGHYLGLAEAIATEPAPGQLIDISDSVPESRFRVDVSSTSRRDPN